MANIKGVDGLSVAEVQAQVGNGGRFVMFGYCMSFLIITLRRSSDIYFIPASQSAVAAGLPYTFLSLLIGWWGFPWGFIYTPMVLAQNLSGGKDVTAEVMGMFGVSEPVRQGLPPVQVQ